MDESSGDFKSGYQVTELADKQVFAVLQLLSFKEHFSFVPTPGTAGMLPFPIIVNGIGDEEPRFFFPVYETYEKALEHAAGEYTILRCQVKKKTHSHQEVS